MIGFKKITRLSGGFQGEKGWQLQPKLSDSPRLIDDFAKRLVFGEIQFGNSATLMTKTVMTEREANVPGLKG